MEETYTLPCLDPVGSIPQDAIKGDQLRQEQEMMVTNFQKQAPPPNPEVMNTSWLERAMKNWGPEWGDIVAIGIPTKS
eukprot:8282606-Karenia_brevis.AAC.1